MPNAAARPEPTGWLAPALLIVGALTAWRVLFLALTPMDLFVDEAQYWLWGQELAFGYYSKPPMIGWVIRAFTDLAGSDARFWIRLPGPLFHAATALILGGIAARAYGRRAGILTAAGYATLPMVAVASALISTDTIMFPFLAAALAGYLRLTDRPGAGLAVLTGVALGLAFLSKYAAIYYLLCAPLAALLIPSARPRMRDAALVLAAFAVTVSPNLIWNALNGFSTFEHTMDNADWVREPAARAGLNPMDVARFLGSQFMVFGPVLFAGLVWRVARLGRADARARSLLLFSWPIILLICGQAFLSGAYANWAAAAYLAGSIAVLPWLARPALIASFLLNGTLALALPVLTTYGGPIQMGGKSILSRYEGRDEMSLEIIALAKANGLTTIVANSRDILADLMHTGRDSGLAIYALPPSGRAPHHYALKFPYPGGDQPVLFVADDPAPPACAPEAQPLAAISPETGNYRKRTKTLYRVPGSCWDQ